MKTQLRGRTAIVTGASAGIGAAIVAVLADAGVRVVGGARRVDRIQAEVALPLDLTDRESCERFVAEAVERVGAIDILVNNAGVNRITYMFPDSTEEHEAEVLGTNLVGLVRLTRLCLSHLREPAHIVNIGSGSSRGSHPGAAAYLAAKYGERGFTYALREDLIGRAIRVTTVDPGLTETELALVKFQGDREKAAAQFAGLEVLQPEEVAECVIFALTRPTHVNIDELIVRPLDHVGIATILRRHDATAPSEEGKRGGAGP